MMRDIGFNMGSFEEIVAKSKRPYLKTNPLGLEGLAFKDYNDPKEVIDFIETYIDRDEI